MNCPYNKILVTIDRKYKDQVQLESGVTLYQDTTYNPERHVTSMGKVVAIPDVLVGYDNEHIVPEVRVGDEICFNYQVINDCIRDEGGTTYYNLIELDGKEYWMVDYFQVFFIKRNKDIICIGSNVMIEPLQADKDEKFEGSILYMPVMMQKEAPKNKGTIKHIGTKKTNQPTLDVQSGDTVYFRPDFAQRYNVLGKEYIFMKQENLLCKD